MAASGGPRAPLEVQIAAHGAIERGATAEAAIAANNLTHPQDIADIRAAAARVAASGGPRAPVEVRIAARGAIERGATAEAAIAANNLTHPQDIADIRAAAARAAAARVSASGGRRAPVAARLAAREAIERGATAEEAIVANYLTHPRDIADMQETASRVAASGGPRTPAGALARLAAHQAIEEGATAEAAIAANNLTHPQDIADIRAAAARVAASGGPRAPVEVRIAARGAIERGATAEAAIAANNLTHPQDIADIRAAAARVAASGGPRAPVEVRIAARGAIEEGATAEAAIAANNLTHPQDIADIRAAAARVAASGGPRAPVEVRIAARGAIEEGATAEAAIAANNLTHPQDIADIRAAAARVAASGGPRAPVEVQIAARQAIEEGATAEAAIAANNLTHPRDIADVRAAAAQVARR